MISTKRAYAPPSKADGVRVLVDRLWPRGLSKENARIAWWTKEIAPSDGLRRWFGHDPDRFGEFRTRYRQELGAAAQRDVLDDLARRAMHETVTLVYAARDSAHNNAVVLAEEIERRIRRRSAHGHRSAAPAG